MTVRWFGVAMTSKSKIQNAKCLIKNDAIFINVCLAH